MIAQLEGNSGFMCLVCNKIGTQKVNILLIVSMILIECVLKGNLKKHIESMHMTPDAQECPQCGKQFKNKNTLQNHISLVHRKVQHESY